MAFGGLGNNQSRQPVPEINMIPLIDVMLVLLIIFMITAPLMTHAVKLDLPDANSRPVKPDDDAVALSINGDGQLFWQQTPVTREVYRQKLAEAALLAQPPQLHIHADQAAAYRFIAEALADAANAGISRIGFVSEPEK